MEVVLQRERTAHAYVIAQREWVWAVGVAVVMTVLLQLPYALGYVFARPGTEYTGLLVNVEDGSYLSAIGEGIQGAWLYHLPFTHEEHAPAFIEVFYLALGHLARGLNLSAVAMWHAARAAGDLIVFIALYGFIAFFLDDSKQRRVAFLLAILGSGFDWSWLPFEQPNMLSAAPLDWRMPEAHLFFSALTYPHYAIGITLILATFWLGVRMLTENAGGQLRWLLVLCLALGNALVGIVYPFLIFLTASVLSVYYLWLIWYARKILWRQALLLFTAFAFPAPLFLYYQSALASSQALRIWNEQATTLSPNPLHYVLAYAPYLLLGGLALKFIQAQRHELRQSRLTFLCVWVATVAVLLYAPINVQRRFVEGVHIPLAILATVGLFEFVLPRLAQTSIFARLARRPRYSEAGLRQLVIVCILVTTSLANIYVFLAASLQLGVIQPYPLFRPRAEVQAMDWLRDHTSDSEVVLSAYWSGSYIPARSGNTVFIGQRYETLFFEKKLAMVDRFFNAATEDNWRLALLADARVKYVFVGSAERALGDFDPATRSYLVPVFASEGVTVYRVGDAR